MASISPANVNLAEPDRRLEELRNLHRIIELTTYNLVSLRTQCPDDARVKAEIKTLESKLDRLILKQVGMNRHRVADAQSCRPNYPRLSSIMSHWAQPTV